MIRNFVGLGRIGVVHVRNVKVLGYHYFCETVHLSSSGSLDMYEVMKSIYEACPDTYVRSDHGQMIWEEADGLRQARPGYGLYDRALCVAYLNGLWEAIVKEAKE